MTTDDTKPATESERTFWNTGPSFEVRTVAGQVDVRVGGLTIWSFREEDTASRIMAIVGLLEGDLVQPKEIAAAFGIGVPRIPPKRFTTHIDAVAELTSRM